MESTITTKGQATIPKAIREHLGVHAGDRLSFFINPDGSVAILANRPLTSLRGMLPAPNVPITLDQMESAIALGTTER